MQEEKDAIFFLKFPFTKPLELLKVIIIGFVPILNLISIGYIFFAVRKIYEKDYKLPDFDEYPLKSYFIAGFFAVIILIFYIAILYLIRFLLTSVILSQQLMLLIAASLVILVLSIILGLMGIAAMLRFIETESFYEAFNLREVFKKGVKWKFFINMLIVGLVTAGLMLIFMIPIVIILLILITALGQQFMYKLITNPSLTTKIFVGIAYYCLLISTYIISWLSYFPHLMHRVNNKKESLRKLPASNKKGMAIAALILSIIGIPLSILVVPTLLGLILGIVAYVKAKRHPNVYGGKGMAIAAIIISIFAFFIIFIMLFAISIFLSSFIESSSAIVEHSAQKQTAAEKFNNITTKCTDSDGGKNHYIKGSSYGYYDDLINTRQANDFCVSGDPNMLGEQYCEGPVLKIEYYNCPNGCIDGVCK